MINKCFERIAVKLAQSGNIEEKYVALYVVAMQTILAMLVNVLTVLLIGHFLGMWWQGILLFAAFIPLRSYAGGYHARGYISCYLESCTLLTAILLILKYFILRKAPILGLWLLFLAAVAVIFVLAPLADENKPISDKEAVVFKRRTRIVLLVEVVIAGVLESIHSSYCYVVMLAVMLCAALLLLQRLREMVISRGAKEGEKRDVRREREDAFI